MVAVVDQEQGADDEQVVVINSVGRSAFRYYAQYHEQWSSVLGPRFAEFRKTEFLPGRRPEVVRSSVQALLDQELGRPVWFVFCHFMEDELAAFAETVESRYHLERWAYPGAVVFRVNHSSAGPMAE